MYEINNLSGGAGASWEYDPGVVITQAVKIPKKDMTQSITGITLILVGAIGMLILVNIVHGH